ncbi:hypothetical protein PNOK_0539700 [Pyrrhoderma noxium]|uniref:Uncharacterized protein n=1 Tax=Pyrrhoderma noxium TaxID=2282107 RepID=A0A286UGG0_9AGAM|nr:hypothetical protein PNOK_0539700 [Pyrrhoderma noxium]
MISPFLAFLAANYAQFKHVANDIGRRGAKIQLLSQFWALSQDEKERFALMSEDTESHPILIEALEEINQYGGADEESLMQIVNENAVGVIVRSDFSDEESWLSFVETLLAAEKDLTTPTPNTHEGEIVQGEGGIPIVSNDEGDAPESLFALFSPPLGSPLRTRLTNISNLNALRLLNDADARRIPYPQVPQRSNTQSQPVHRLTSLHGFVESYIGPFIWVYDSRSNVDKAVRVVSHCVEGVGSATGDSWRARVSFVPELQLNLINGMRIDFGGLDKWDPSERQRNFADADQF